jgi:hypothetical protein
MSEEHTVSVDAPRVHPSDAVRLMVHHLALAAMYFEATPSEHAPALAEMARQLDKDLVLPAARAFFETLDAAYDNHDQPAED